MGSSSKMASPPAATPAPANTVPYGQTSPDTYSWTNFLPNPATGDPIRPAQLSDPTWQTTATQPPPTTGGGAADPRLAEIDKLKLALAQLIQGGGMNRRPNSDQTQNPLASTYRGGSSYGGGMGNSGTSTGGRNSVGGGLR